MSPALQCQFYRALGAVAFVALFVVVQWAAPAAMHLATPAGPQATPVACAQPAVERPRAESGSRKIERIRL